MPFPVKLRILSATSRTSGLPVALLSVPDIVGVPELALRVHPSSLTGPVIVPLPVKSRILPATFRARGLPVALLNVPAPPIESVCEPTFRSPPE